METGIDLDKMIAIARMHKDFIDHPLDSSHAARRQGQRPSSRAQAAAEDRRDRGAGVMRITDVRTYVARTATRLLAEPGARVSTPMSIYPKFSEKRASWRGPNTQDVFIEVISDEGVTGLGITRGGG